MQTEPAKLYTKCELFHAKGGGKGSCKAKSNSAAGSNRSGSQSARSSHASSVRSFRSASVSRSPGSHPATPPMRQVRETRQRSPNQGRPIERINEMIARRTNVMTDEETAGLITGPPHLRPSAGDPWYYAPLSGSCYHLERNCAGLRNARHVQSVECTVGKNRLLVVNNLRPCRMCASQDRHRHRQQ